LTEGIPIPWSTYLPWIPLRHISLVVSLASCLTLLPTKQNIGNKITQWNSGSLLFSEHSMYLFLEITLIEDQTKLSRTMFTCLQLRVYVPLLTALTAQVSSSGSGPRARIGSPPGHGVLEFCSEIRLRKFYFQPCFCYKRSKYSIVGKTWFRTSRNC